jgi:hypothetical protein
MTMCEALPQSDCDKMEFRELTCSRQDSRANLTALLANALHQMTIETCGKNVQGCFAILDRDGRFLRTYQGYFQANLDGSLDEYSGTFPKHGMMLSGQCTELPMLGRRTKGIGFSSWPTPAAQDGKNSTFPPSQIDRDTVPGAIMRNWPTPIAGNGRNGCTADSERIARKVEQGWTIDLHYIVKVQEGEEKTKGQLNADWVEILMGFDIGWTDIECDNPLPWPGWPAPLGAGNWPTPQSADGTSGCAVNQDEYGYDNNGKPYRKTKKGEVFSCGLGRMAKAGLMPTGQYPYEPPRVITGQKNRAKRLKCIGNAVSPEQIEPIFAAISWIELGLT